MPEFDSPPRPAASERGSSSAAPTLPDRIGLDRIGLDRIGLDRLREWRTDRRVAVAIAVLVVVAAATVWIRTSSERSSPAGASAGASATPTVPAGGAPSGEATTTSGPRLLLHVVGAVRAAGVVELASGARVRDAVAAAGGAADDADLERMNLAAPVTDGQRIAVPRIGQPDLPPVAGDAAPTGPGPDAVSGPLNLNTATAAELEQLPGIGPTLAEAIVREREKRGRFDSVEDLKQVRGIGDGRFADIRDLVTV